MEKRKDTLADSVHPVIMTIAGSDSGGGAGIQADSKTITALGGFAITVIAALTAQNGAEVRGVFEIPPAFVVEQLLTVQDGFPIKAAKTGMLSSANIIEALAPVLANRNYPLVVDPVCVSQSGYRLLREDALAKLIEHIIPQADLLTPNKPEAEVLTGIKINSADSITQVMEKFWKMGAKAVLLKGGHFEEYQSTTSMIDWFAVQGSKPVAIAHERVDTPNNHGTGCTLSAAIATFLGKGYQLENAIIEGKDYLRRALAKSYAPGIGAGPPNFMA